MALKENLFLGLRLNRGICVDDLRQEFGVAVAKYEPIIEELISAGLLAKIENRLRLTARGRLLSNEVFEKFLLGHEAKEPAGIPA